MSSKSGAKADSGSTLEAADELSAAAAELYALEPAKFIARRNELAKEARGRGSRTLAASIGSLPKPSPSAWLVNMLVHHRPGQIEMLLDLGHSLRRAQEDLDQVLLRELGKERRRLLDGLAAESRKVAQDLGHKVSGPAAAQAEQTLWAAITDLSAEVSILSGQLVRPLSTNGLDPVDLTGAVAVPGARVEPDNRQVAAVEATRGTGTGRRPGHASAKPADKFAAGKSKVEQEATVRSTKPGLQVFAQGAKPGAARAGAQTAGEAEEAEQAKQAAAELDEAKQGAAELDEAKQAAAELDEAKQAAAELDEAKQAAAEADRVKQAAAKLDEAKQGAARSVVGFERTKQRIQEAADRRTRLHAERQQLEDRLRSVQLDLVDLDDEVAGLERDLDASRTAAENAQQRTERSREWLKGSAGHS